MANKIGKIKSTIQYGGRAYEPKSQTDLDDLNEAMTKEGAPPLDLDRLKKLDVIGDDGDDEEEEDEEVTRLAAGGATIGNAEGEEAGGDDGRYVPGMLTEEKKPGPRSTGAGEGTGKVGVDELEDHLRGIDDPKEIRKMMRKDERVTAQPIYERRLEELRK